ncbi:MAG TPA: copper chaperone [Rhodospirillales bacterium]|nr:copper chaperone [Rhodospirillales bacterium]
MLKSLKWIGLIAALTITAATSANAGTHSYNLYVDGLACPFCAYGVEKQVGGLKNVDSIDILIDEGIVAVTMAADKKLDEAKARQAVSDAGFTLRKFESVKGNGQ